MTIIFVSHQLEFSRSPLNTDLEESQEQPKAKHWNHTELDKMVRVKARIIVQT